MNKALKEIAKDMEEARNTSGYYYALGNDKLGIKYNYIAVGLEMAHKTLVSELLLKTGE